MSRPARSQTPQSSTSSPTSSSYLTTASSNLNGDGSSDGGSLNEGRWYKHRNGLEKSGYGENGNGEFEDSAERKRRQITSGGFLLDSVIPRSGLKRHTIHDGSKEKGKGKITDSNIPDRVTVKKRSRQHPKPLLGTSPLATEVIHTAPPLDQDEIAAIPSESTHSSGHVPNGATTAHQDRQSRSEVNPDLKGFDTDPAQIVKLALNLSENRRRHFSAGRLSAVDTGNSRRIASSGQLTGYSAASTSNSVGGSLRQHLQQQRRVSRNISPRSAIFGRAGGVSSSARPLPNGLGNIQSPIIPTLDLGLLDDFEFTPSDATLARAEKARLSVELFYEYRRLLQYLPNLPVLSKSRPTTAKATSKNTVEAPPTLGRTYNPLQYIRNRKVRARERRAFNAETDGWKDLHKVREWINSVANEREDHVSKVDDRYPLPAFDLGEVETLAQGSSPVSSLRHVKGLSVTQSRRPRMDWFTTPWDMLADAYWLEQGENKRSMEDRDGKKLFAVSHSPIKQSPRNSRDLVRDSAKRSDSITRLSRSPTRVDEVILDARDSSVKHRGRRQHEYRGSIGSLQDSAGSQDRKPKWRKIIRSRSSSSSEGSRRDSINSLQQFSLTQENRERQDSAVLERQIMEMLEKEGETMWSSPEGPERVKDVLIQSDRAQHKRRKDVTKQFQNFSLKKSRRQKTNDSIQTSGPSSNRPSLEEERGRKLQKSYEDLDVTLPNSPTAKEFVPSISIKLSPSASRSVSPKKSIPLPYKGRMNQSEKRRSIGQTDFAVDVESSKKISQRDLNGANQYAPPAESTTTPSDGLLSPKTAESFGRNLHRRRTNSNSIKGAKEPKEDSRFRSFLKGGRIGELVGNEVSKVGGLLWRKENSNHSPYVSSPVSIYASEISDTDDDELIRRLKTVSSNNLSRTLADGYDEGKLSRKSTNSDQPKYHMSNLPSFKSPFRKDDQSRGSSKVPREEDHISRQQIALRARGRSSRFESLALPKVDTGGVSPSSSLSLSRVQTVDTDVNLDESRRNSTNPSEQGSQSAYHRYSGTHGFSLARRPPVTGLARLDIRNSRSNERSATEGKRQWSISDRGVSAVRGAVTKKEYTRIRALLLSSGVKANEIARRAGEIRDPPPPLLQALQKTFTDVLPRVPRFQEHVLAGGVLLDKINGTVSGLKEAAHQLSDTTINELHDHIKAIDNRMTTELTPLVRASADDADALNTQLATSQRLTVKRLNDSIDLIMRRRRRRLRYIRRGGYLLLEWTLLALMWLVWLIVVMIRLVRGTVLGVVNSVRWLFWL